MGETESLAIVAAVLPGDGEHLAAGMLPKAKTKTEKQIGEKTLWETEQ